MELSFIRIDVRGKQTSGKGKWVTMLIQTMVSQRCAEGSLVEQMALGGLVQSLLRTQGKPWTSGELFGASGLCTEFLHLLGISVGHSHIPFVPGCISLPLLQYNGLIF